MARLEARNPHASHFHCLKLIAALSVPSLVGSARFSVAFAGWRSIILTESYSRGTHSGVILQMRLVAEVSKSDSATLLAEQPRQRSLSRARGGLEALFQLDTLP